MFDLPHQWHHFLTPSYTRVLISNVLDQVITVILQQSHALQYTSVQAMSLIPPLQIQTQHNKAKNLEIIYEVEAWDQL